MRGEKASENSVLESVLEVGDLYFKTFCLLHMMSKAPQGVFQEELEWCISQLEAALHLTPHPKLGMEGSWAKGLE